MKEKVLIVVKAYPAISTKYRETVCTAGITEDGRWIRIYPVPFRLLEYEKRYKKYDWILVDLVKHEKDFRPESYRPVNFNTTEHLGKIPPDGNTWSVRRKYVQKNVFTNLTKLISEAKSPEKCTSIALFRPTKIIDFIYEPVSVNWDKTKLQKIKSSQAQISLFETNDINDIENFEIVDKLPYKFSFIFLDDENRESKLMIEDWETGMLYWNSLKKFEGDEIRACEDVKKKYFYDFAKTKDYYFILGSLLIHHRMKSKNPFAIIGDFRPKPITQTELF